MATQLTTTRQERGEAIVKLDGQIKRIDDNTYEVLSQSGHGVYEVLNSSIGWMCQCPDHIYRGVKCKHIHAVEISKSIRAEVAVRRIEPIETLTECIYCGSNNLKKDGVRKNKSGTIQKFYCRDCHKYMTFNIGFEKTKHNPQAVTTAMQLYFSGESLRNTANSLKLLGVEVTHKTVFMWIKKYVKLMKDYVEKITPNVSDTWRADEIYMKVKGYMKYLFAMMNDETRFWIAQEVAETKHKHDARKLLEEKMVIVMDSLQMLRKINEDTLNLALDNFRIGCLMKNAKSFSKERFRILLEMVKNASSNVSKKNTLESLAEYLFNNLKGFKVLEKDYRGPSEEIDLLVANESQDPVFRDIGNPIAVECRHRKNQQAAKISEISEENLRI